MSNLEYKDLKVLESLFTHAWHSKLINVLLWIVVRYSEDHILFTSGYREGDPGVHGTDPLRGFDLRSSVFDNPQDIVDDINKHWIYDPDRPEMKVAILHNVGQGIHFHIQVHPHTITINS